MQQQGEDAVRVVSPLTCFDTITLISSSNKLTNKKVVFTNQAWCIFISISFLSFELFLVCFATAVCLGCIFI